MPIDPGTTPPADAAIHAKALWWRTEVLRMSRRQLAELSGYSESRIQEMEAGFKWASRGRRTPIDEASIRRYCMVVAAVSLGVEFDFVTLSLAPTAPVRITIGVGENRSSTP